ncbi:flagellar protein, partial [Jeotgalibaca porci]
MRINQHSYQTSLQPIVPKQTKNFEETLTSTDLKVSNHARKRLEQRGYALEQQDMTTLNTAVNELEEKGSEQSLLLYKDLALIASVRNRTIITALNPDE